jgi:hypothetical protein
MKQFFAILFTTMSLAVVAQQPLIKDSLPAKLVVKNATALKTNRPATLSTTATITPELNKIVAAYCIEPDNADTWVKIKTEAENKLYAYFKAGALAGTKSTEAYFVKMDASTMSAADIANKKMILQAGIATQKPAEFTILTIEKKCL